MPLGIPNRPFMTVTMPSAQTTAKMEPISGQGLGLTRWESCLTASWALGTPVLEIVLGYSLGAADAPRGLAVATAAGFAGLVDGKKV